MKKLTLFLMVLSCIVSQAQVGYKCGSNYIHLIQVSEGSHYYEIANEDGEIMKKTLSSKTINVNNKECVKYHSCTFINQFGDSVIILPQIIVKVKRAKDFDSVLKEYDGKLALDSINSTGLYKLKCLVDNPIEVLTLNSQLFKMDCVDWCEPNMRMAIIPLNTYYSDQYYLKNTGQNQGTPGVDINVEEAWSITSGSPNITVAVIDSGVEHAHEDLVNCVLNGYTMGESTGNGEPIGASPDEAHGTECAGIIAATDNNIGIKGVSSGVKILPINYRTYKNDFDSLAEAIRWAYPRADVISCSWKLSDGYISNNIANAIQEAVIYGRNGKGTSVVFASGNDGDIGVAFPACVDSVITVGAMRNNGLIWYYSQRGPSMDLVAPSGDSWNMGDVVTTDRMGTQGYESGNYTDNFGGTSAACPQVAGVIASMLSINPNLTATQIMNILRVTARDYGEVGRDDIFGYGLVDAGAAVKQSYLAQTHTFSIKKTYTGKNHVVCSVNNLPNYLHVVWEYYGSMTMTQDSPTLSKCTLTKTGSDYPSGTIICNVYLDATRVYRAATSIGVSSSGTYRQDACSYYGVSHPAISPKTITSGSQAKMVHQGCRVYLYCSVFNCTDVTYTGVTPSDWYVANDHVEFSLPLGSGGVPFVVNVKDMETNNLDYWYTFFSVSNNGNVLNITPIGSNCYCISLEEEEYTLLTSKSIDFDTKTLTQLEWMFEVYSTITGNRVVYHDVKDRSTTLDVSGWTPGTYLIRAVVGGEIYSEKLLIR